MGKTIILNLRDITLNGNVLDVGESYGVIYNLSKEAMINEELAVDCVDINYALKVKEAEYDICTVFFHLSNLWSEGQRTSLIKTVNNMIKTGGEIYIWDVNKERGEVNNSKIMAVLPSGKVKEFEFKNINPMSKSSIEETKKILGDNYIIKEEKLWEDIYFLKAEKK